MTASLTRPGTPQGAPKPMLAGAALAIGGGLAAQASVARLAKPRAVVTGR